MDAPETNFLYSPKNNQFPIRPRRAAKCECENSQLGTVLHRNLKNGPDELEKGHFDQCKEAFRVSKRAFSGRTRTAYNLAKEGKGTFQV